MTTWEGVYSTVHQKLNISPSGNTVAHTLSWLCKALIVLISKRSIKEIKTWKFLRFTVARGNNIPSSYSHSETKRESKRKLKRKKSQKKESEHVRKKGSAHMWGLIYKTVCKILTNSTHASKSAKKQFCFLKQCACTRAGSVAFISHSPNYDMKKYRKLNQIDALCYSCTNT